MIDATLAVEDVKSKPVDVDAFADVKRVLKMGLKVTADSWATTSQVPLQLDNSFQGLHYFFWQNLLVSGLDIFTLSRTLNSRVRGAFGNVWIRK